MSPSMLCDYCHEFILALGANSC